MSISRGDTNDERRLGCPFGRKSEASRKRGSPPSSRYFQGTSTLARRNGPREGKRRSKKEREKSLRVGPGTNDRRAHQLITMTHSARNFGVFAVRAVGEGGHRELGSVSWEITEKSETRLPFSGLMRSNKQRPRTRVRGELVVPGAERAPRGRREPSSSSSFRCSCRCRCRHRRRRRSVGRSECDSVDRWSSNEVRVRRKKIG